MSITKSLFAAPLALLLIALALTLGCSRREPARQTASAGATPSSAPANAGTAPSSAPASTEPEQREQSARKVMRRAELSIEVPSAAKAQSRVTRVTELHGGYVDSSSVSSSASDADRESSTVTMILRVPAEKLSTVLDAVKRLGAGESSERISSIDATEEYIDLEARLDNQRRLETQFLEILKDAKTVTDALNVQQELAKVRTEIDRMEGRRRFIDKESALSTIEVTLTTAKPLVAVSFADFERSAVGAYSDAVSVGSGLLLGAIRAAGVLLPLFVLGGIPVFFAVRILRRRSERRARALAET